MTEVHKHCNNMYSKSWVNFHFVGKLYRMYHLLEVITTRQTVCKLCKCILELAASCEPYGFTAGITEGKIVKRGTGHDETQYAWGNNGTDACKLTRWGTSDARFCQWTIVDTVRYWLVASPAPSRNTDGLMAYWLLVTTHFSKILIKIRNCSLDWMNFKTLTAKWWQFFSGDKEWLAWCLALYNVSRNTLRKLPPNSCIACYYQKSPKWKSISSLWDQVLNA